MARRQRDEAVGPPKPIRLKVKDALLHGREYFEERRKRFQAQYMNEPWKRRKKPYGTTEP